MNDEEKKKDAIDLLKMYTEQQARAFGALRQASLNYDSDATSRISACYYLGVGCMQNFKAAATYAKKVALSNTDSSKALAQFIYGSCLRLGEGVLQSHEEAIKYFSLAAKSGLRLAKYRLASYYSSGQGGVLNMRRARELFLEAAYAGDSASMAVVGQMCLEGIGGPSDGDQAIFWFQRAADAGDPMGMQNYALCCENGVGVPKDLQKAASMFEGAAQYGYLPAMCALSAFYMKHPELSNSETFSQFWMAAAFEEDAEFASAICNKSPDKDRLEGEARLLLDRMHEYNELMILITKPPQPMT